MGTGGAWEPAFAFAEVGARAKHGDVNIDAIIPVAIGVFVIAGLLTLSFVQVGRSRKNLEALGAKLGLKPVTTGRVFKKTRLTGQLRGRPAEIFSYTTGSGKSQQNWAAVAVQVKSTGGLTFSLKRRMTLFDFIARLFRKNEVGVGDTDFDKNWVLTTNQPDFICAALLPEMREKIQRSVKAGRFSGHYALALYKVSYAEQGSFSTREVCERIESVVDGVCDLADMVEVGAELQK
jgi:hypothetical protein